MKGCIAFVPALVAALIFACSSSSTNDNRGGSNGNATMTFTLSGGDFTGNSVRICGSRPAPDPKYRCNPSLTPDVEAGTDAGDACPCFNFNADGSLVDANGVPAAITGLCPSADFPTANWDFSYALFSEPDCGGTQLNDGTHNFTCYDSKDVATQAFPNQSANDVLNPGPNINHVLCNTVNASKSWNFMSCATATTPADTAAGDIRFDCGCTPDAGTCDCGNGGVTEADLEAGCLFDPVTCNILCTMPPDDACLVASELAVPVEFAPENLVVMLDRSGTMGDLGENTSYDPQERWVPVTNAIEAFFANNGSAGINAALTFFPNTANSCNASDYYTANVPLTALPNDTAFRSAIDTHLPLRADTPTLAAVNGAIYQAHAISAAHPEGRTVIVLITDGEPYCCSYLPAPNRLGCINGADPLQDYADINSDANLIASANAIASVEATIPTYVIGVGPDTANLTTLANAGGTSLIPVDVASNPADTSSALLAALNTIRGNVVSCDFNIPNPPDGRTLDFNKVDVAYTPPGQAVQTLLPYSADCSMADGWHFDNFAAPTRIQFCADTCDLARQSGLTEVVFGCDDRPGN
ncbi:MAG: VWA domain-containing protein [Polyangiaceae bacterium]|nr:VWA domain-containing protein [Polyangiaceae bacterium]